MADEWLGFPFAAPLESPPPAEEEEEELPSKKTKGPCNYPELPFASIFGRTREQVQRIQIVINQYIKTRKLSIPPVEVNGNGMIN